MIEGTNWDICDAVALIRSLQRFAEECGYNLSLGGGVLNKGYSENDLNIVAVPRGKEFKADRVRFETVALHQRRWGIPEDGDSVQLTFPKRLIKTYTDQLGRKIDIIWLESV